MLFSLWDSVNWILLDSELFYCLRENILLLSLLKKYYSNTDFLYVMPQVTSKFDTITSYVIINL